MRRLLTLLTSAVVAISGLSVVAPVPAGAATSCVYTPIVPKRVVVNQAVVGIRIPLKIAGPSGCADPLVSTHLVHSTDDYFLLWTNRSPDSESVYASSIKPGVYRTTASDCTAYDSDFNSLSCSVTSAATVIKYAGRASLSAKRKGKRVTLTARTGRFDAYNGSAPTTGRVTIQRLNGRQWTTIKHATASGKKGYIWSFTKAKKARYRVVSGETATAFVAVSRSVKK